MFVHKEKFTTELLVTFSKPYQDKQGRAALLRNLRWGRQHITFQDYPQIIQSITVPTLIIQGRQDPYLPASQATRTHQMIEDSQLIFIEDGGHFLPIDTPKAVATAINQFIN